MQVFSDSDKVDIKSVGLVFEPNFFTVYYYSDIDAESAVGYDRKERSETKDLSALKAYAPLFAITFKPEWTLIPKSLFSENDAAALLSFNTSFEGDKAEWDEILGIEAVQIFGRDELAEKLIEPVFPGLRVTHGARSLIELHRKTPDLKSKTLVFQAENAWYFTIFKNGKLLFANAISADYPEDVRYFLFYTFKQLNLDTNQTVVLLGEAVMNLGLKNLLEKYLSTEFISENKLQLNSLPPETLAQHWAGIYASICAL